MQHDLGRGLDIPLEEISRERETTNSIGV